MVARILREHGKVGNLGGQPRPPPPRIGQRNNAINWAVGTVATKIVPVHLNTTDPNALSDNELSSIQNVVNVQQYDPTPMVPLNPEDVI